MGYETRMRNKQGDPVNVKIWSERIELDNEPCNLTFTLNVTEEKRKADLLLSVAKGVSGQTGEAFFQSLVEQLALATGAHGVVVAEVTAPNELVSLALTCGGEPVPTTALPLEGVSSGASLAGTRVVALPRGSNHHFFNVPRPETGPRCSPSPAWPCAMAMDPRSACSAPFGASTSSCRPTSRRS